jgi:hypothetical protein
MASDNEMANWDERAVRLRRAPHLLFEHFDK